MENFLNTLSSSRGNCKAEVLKKALEDGDSGIDLLIEALGNPELIVRVEAYKLLDSLQSDKAADALSQGILLNPGDNIYCVYESTIQYNDNWWYLLDSFKEVLYDSDWESTKFISFHINRGSAEQAADKFHLLEVSTQHNICPFDINDMGTNDDVFREDFNYIFKWCETHDIPFKLPDIKNNENDSKYAYIKYALLLESSIEEYLFKDKKHQLLAQLWLDAVGRFAFIQPMVVQETMYLKLKDNI